MQGLSFSALYVISNLLRLIRIIFFRVRLRVTKKVIVILCLFAHFALFLVPLKAGLLFSSTVCLHIAFEIVVYIRFLHKSSPFGCSQIYLFYVEIWACTKCLKQHIYLVGLYSIVKHQRLILVVSILVDRRRDNTQNIQKL